LNNKTPITDFIKEYQNLGTHRLHMPGHKGQAVNGLSECWDITEVDGADDLYHPQGIIDESEKIASSIFECPTVYGTEGSSQCIKAMLYLATMRFKEKYGSSLDSHRPYVIAPRNVHKAFVHACGLIDLDVIWLWPSTGDKTNICSCPIDLAELKTALQMRDYPPVAVYITTPDYLGGIQSVAPLYPICHQYGTILLIDGAHGSYFKFLDHQKYPDYEFAMDSGGDMCCTSAHKTLPVLTGGAYLHYKEGLFTKTAVKSAMAMFGSSSPSYLIMASLDNFNGKTYDFKKFLGDRCDKLDTIKANLRQKGYLVTPSDPLKITIAAPDGLTGADLAKLLARENCSCEYYDDEYLVMMLSPYNTDEDLEAIERALGENQRSYSKKGTLPLHKPEVAMSIRQALFEAHPADDGICHDCKVSCPPAISPIMPGEKY